MSAIAMTPVESSNIDAIGYDQATRTLAVRFKGGALHQYPDVPPETHADFIGAESVGKFFHASIRSQFEGRRVDEDDA